jgi:cell filamentation protein
LLYSADYDPLWLPGTTVLRNRLGITDQDTLDEVELALFLIRADEPLPAGKFDVAHYLSIHRHLFQDVYTWAGEIRSIRVGKAGNWFCYPEYIPGELARAFREYGDADKVAELPPDEFARQTAHLLAEINAVHPFREGNGRTQLTFLTLLAANAGYAVNDGVLDPAEVLSAMIESFGGREDRLAALILAYIS